MRRVTWLGHATVLIEAGGARLLTDPVLRERVAAPRRRVPAAGGPGRGRRRADLARAPRPPRQAVAARLARRAAVAAGRRGATYLPAGLHDVREVRAGDTRRRSPARRARPSRPGTTAAAGPGPAPTELDTLGYLVDGIWFAGDTDLDDGMAELRGARRRRADPDLGLGPVARARAHGPRARRRAAIALIAAADRDPDPLGHLPPVGLARARAAADRAAAASSPLTWPSCASTRVETLAPGGSLVAVGRRGRARRASRGRSRWTASAPTTGSSGHGRSGGASTNGCACPPPSPPCEPTSSSNAATSSSSAQ